MSIDEWNQRYRAGEQLFEEPAPLVEEFASRIPAGTALDVACGAGRNALYLAERGWRVTAIDGSPVAIEVLRRRAAARDVNIDARVADLERSEFEIPPDTFDLIVDSYYLQRDLIPAMQRGLHAGGMLIVIVHLSDAEPTPTRVVPGELKTYFHGWNVLHDYEGVSRESCHRRAVAEIVAVKL